jgi:AraC-like DNA-binding protein
MMGRSKNGPDWRWENLPVNFDSLNIWTVVSGKGTMRVCDETYAFTAGDCFVLPSWQHSIAEADASCPPTVQWAVYQYRQLAHHRAATCLPRIYRRLKDPLLINQFFECSRSAFAAEGELQEPANLFMSALLAAVERDERSSELRKMERQRDERVRQLCVQIQTDPGHATTIAEMAESCGYSTGYFNRLFHLVTGQSPSDFISDARIAMAKTLLSASNESITRIAEQLGYCDPYHFSRQFRERTGMAPSDFRRRRATALLQENAAGDTPAEGQPLDCADTP